MPRFTVIAYAQTESRFDFEVDAATEAEAERVAQRIIDNGSYGKHYVHDTDTSTPIINSDLTEETDESEAAEP